MPLYKQGDIVLLPYPFSDLSQSKPRPSVVISHRESINGDLIVVKITSNLHNDSDSFILEPQKLNGVLPALSEVRCNQISTIDKRIVMKKYASLNQDALKSLCEKIKLNFEVIE